MRLEAQAKAGFYPTPPEVVEIIQTWIGEKTPGLRRLLDPCCGTGEPAARISAAAGCDAYGVEINTERAKRAKTLLSKVAAGDLFSVRARPGAFSILYLNPPYDFDAEDGRTELSFLKHTLPYLTPRGLLLFVVPQKRITLRIARVLSSLTQIQSMDLPEIHRKEFSFTVPTVGRDFFIRSSEFGPDELAEELNESSLWKESALGLLEEDGQTRPASQPLMPPRKAHLAMLIAAGLINNQILEANGKRLLIKGTAKKVIDRFEEETEKGIKITERERIVTQINAFDLKTGEYLQIV